MRPYKSFVLRLPVLTEYARCVFKCRKMKGRVIYKCIKNECVYEGAVFQLLLRLLTPGILSEIVFICFEFRGTANAGSKQTMCLISAVSSACFFFFSVSCDRWRPGQQRRLTEYRGRRWPRKGKETQQEERDLPQSGHQHHESMALPAPNGEFTPAAAAAASALS